jgi:PAS domain S-box-containing protein
LAASLEDEGSKYHLSPDRSVQKCSVRQGLREVSYFAARKISFPPISSQNRHFREAARRNPARVSTIEQTTDGLGDKLRFHSKKAPNKSGGNGCPPGRSSGIFPGGDFSWGRFFLVEEAPGGIQAESLGAGDRGYEMQVLKSRAENSSDVISLVTAAGKILYASPSSVNVFGYLPEEVVGRSTFDLIDPGDRDRFRRALGTVLARPPGPRQVKVCVRRKDGERRWVESTFSNLLDEPRIGAIVVNCRAIGALPEAGEMERRQAEDLIRSNARLEDFAYAVAHDLREPLRTISMFTDILIQEAEMDAHGELMAQFIMNGVARMSALFEGLHAFAVHGFDDPAEPLDLAIVVTDVLHDLGHAITTSNATVTVDPLPFVQGNEKHLARVFQNLIVNAIKYRSEAPVRIHVTAERMGRQWAIKVQDNGVGIAAENFERVFGLFKRLHGPETPGAGIGLAICRKIIEAMGGVIWVESEPGSGSVFCFTVAAAEEVGAGSAIPDRTPAQGMEVSPAREFSQWSGIRRSASGG